MSLIFFVLYFFILSVLIIFALHRYLLLYLYYKNRNKPYYKNINTNMLPKVTVQLPVYNESAVIKRLILSICALDYPKELLQIQLLDDSDDITRDSGLCNKYCQVGVDVMKYAKEGKSFSNKETVCIGCGICITVCPKRVLKFG